MKKGKVYVKTSELKVESIPALMIGRFAVQKQWRGKGIGRFMMRHIVGLALEMQQYQGLRLLVLNAKPGSVRFYQRMGFDFTDDRAEKNKRNKTMFLDLEAIKDVA